MKLWPTIFCALGAFYAACSDNESSVSSQALSSSAENVANISSGTVTPESSMQMSSSSKAEPASSAALSDTGVSSSQEVLESSSANAVTWNKANLTWYESYPDEGSEECIEYNGCEWAGYFAGLEDKQTPEWVAANNIIAVHEKDWDTYKLKTFRLRKNGHEIDAIVYDMCSDSDCDGCCTKNAGAIGFLIDIEVNTKARFGNQGDGVVEWTCIDCDL